MLEFELYLLKEILKLMPRFGLSFEKFQHDTGIVTSQTLYNWLFGRCKPHRRKYNEFRAVLKERYRDEYNAIIKIIDEANGNKLKNMLLFQYDDFTSEVNPYR